MSDRWLELVLDCLVRGRDEPLAVDVLALERALRTALVPGVLGEAVEALAGVAHLLGQGHRSPGAARAVYAALERRVRSLEAVGLDGVDARARGAAQRAPMLGAAAPAGTVRMTALAGVRRRA